MMRMGIEGERRVPVQRESFKVKAPPRRPSPAPAPALALVLVLVLFWLWLECIAVSTMTSPLFVYKILPKTPEYSFPVPFPTHYSFITSPLDKHASLTSLRDLIASILTNHRPRLLQDGFLHLSTSAQLLNTLSRFFATPLEGDGVTLLKLAYPALVTSHPGDVKWDKAGNGEREFSYFRMSWCTYKGTARSSASSQCFLIFMLRCSGLISTAGKSLR